MEDQKSEHINRRKFICSLSMLVAGSGFVLAGPKLQKSPGKTPRLWDPLEPDEELTIKKSSMAQSIVQYPKKKLSCAESILLSSLEYLEKPRDWLSLAGGFGGGLGQRDLCGLLTGGVMAIGVAAGTYHQDRNSFQRFIKERRKQYWEWWQARSPIHCREMRIQYDRPGYFRMIQRVAARMEQLIAPEKS